MERYFYCRTGRVLRSAFTVSFDDDEPIWREPPAEEADDPRTGDQQRKRQVEEEYPDKRRHGQRDHPPVLEHSFADPQDRFDDDRQDSRFESEEHRLHETRLLTDGVEDAQAEDAEEAQQNEQDSRHQSAKRAVQ